MKNIFLLRQTLIACMFVSFAGSNVLFGQFQYASKYPDIPIVDVHVHANRADEISKYIQLSDIIKDKYGSNLAFFVLVNEPEDSEETFKAAANNRTLFAVSEMRPHLGLTVTPEEVISKVRNKGYVGFKFWFGDPRRVLQEGDEGMRRIDDPAFENLFSALERERVLMTCLHIADPNGPFGDRQVWMADPVVFWTQIRAFENVVAKYPNLPIVAAHCAWLFCQDAQVDYLRYMLSTYPNLYIELSATFSYLYLLNPENLRDFFIEYQDRVLYGSDFSRPTEKTNLESMARQYAVHFSILESDHEVVTGYRNSPTVRGLNLPKEVLEKIYYKNALKIYPGLKEAMGFK